MVTINNIAKYNYDRYNNEEELDNYSKIKNHKLRIDIELALLDKAFNKSEKINKSDFKVLDIGGNTGVVSVEVKERGYNATVADIAPKAIQVAKDRGLNTIKMDFDDTFPIKDETYDAIIAGEVIEHVFDTNKFLSECNRILKKDGFMIITTPNLATFRDRIKFLFGIMPRQINPHHEYLKLHIRPFTYLGLNTALKKNNFIISKFTSNYLIFDFLGKALMFRTLARIFPRWGSTLIVLVYKK